MKAVVSILILLEVILEDLEKAKQEALENGFNPYFTGSNSGRRGLRYAVLRI